MNAVPDDGFRFMTVVATHGIAPRMQRLRLAGDDLARFDTFANLHVRLYVTDDPDRPLQRPVFDDEGRPRIEGYAIRYYTIRAIDAQAGWLDMDFVLHDDAGPACDFARRARPGDVCGISGPCGLSVKPARRYVLAGDETALPAIARIAETVLRNTEGTILIDAGMPDDRLDLVVPPSMSVDWLFRSVSPPGAFATRVSEAIAETSAETDDYFIWIAGEYANYLSIRPALEGISKKRHINVPYWRAPRVDGER
ncbi:siderophore-interacting protein [Pseudochelatococcus sp. B33]